MDLRQAAFVLLMLLGLASRILYCRASQTCKDNDIRTAVLLNRETQTNLREMKMEVEQQLQSLRKELSDANTRLGNQEDEIKTLNETLSGLRNELSEAHTRLDNKDIELTTVSGTLAGAVSNLNSALNQKGQQLSQLQGELNSYKAHRAYTAFFLVHSPSSLTLNYGDIIQYGVIQYGTGYDSSTGKYTVPESGLYAFSHQICSAYTSHNYFSIVKDGIYLLPGEMEITGSGIHCSSGSVYVYAQKGEKVWVQAISGTLNLVNYDTYRTSFSGALINRSL